MNDKDREILDDLVLVTTDQRAHEGHDERKAAYRRLKKRADEILVNRDKGK